MDTIFRNSLDFIELNVNAFIKRENRKNLFFNKLT